MFIENWQLIRDLDNLPKIWQGQTTPQGYEGAYVPLRTSFLLVFFQLWGDNIFFYHLFSLLTHLSATTLVYLITKQLVMSSPGVSRTIKYLPFITALFFGLHPIHTDAITFMLASVDSFNTVLYLASFLCYIHFSKEPSSLKFYILSVTLAIIALFYFEFSIILPLVLILYEIIIRKKSFKKLLNSYKIFLPFLLGVFFFLFIRIMVLKIFFRSGGYIADSFYLTMLTMTKVWVKYISLLIFPVDLSIDPVISEGIYSLRSGIYDYSRVISQSISDPQIISSIAVLITFSLAAIKFFKKNPLITFSISWFFITLLPVSQIIPTGAIMQERHAYLASFGFILLLGVGFLQIGEKMRLNKNTILAVALIITAFYFFQTYNRNKDWKNDISLWSKVVEQAPDDILANFALAESSVTAGDIENAKQHYIKTLELNPNIPDAQIKLGKIYFTQNKPQQALLNFNAAIRLIPDFEQADQVFDALISLADNNPDLITRNDGIWRKYLDLNRLMFLYPQDWSVAKKGGEVTLHRPDGQIYAQLVIDELENASISDYLVSQTEIHGQLLRQGQALVSQFEYSYAKIFKDSDLQILQLYLFKNQKVLKLRHYLPNFQTDDLFDKIVSTIRI